MTAREVALMTTLHPDCRACREILAEYRRVQTLKANAGSGLPHDLEARNGRLINRIVAHLGSVA